MATVNKKLPSLDGSGFILDKFISSLIARVASTIAATEKGAAGGVAPLDASQHLPVANHVTGGILCVHYNGSTPSVRPTARTDITVYIDAPAGTTKPAWALATDHFDTF